MKSLIAHLSRFGKKISGKYASGSDYYYEVALERYDDISAYSQLISQADDTDCQYTDVSISAARDISMGEGIKRVRKAIINKHKLYEKQLRFSCNIRILYFKTRISRYKVRRELHFFKGLLFYSCITFYEINDDDKEAILVLLHSKYLGKIELPAGHGIIDTSGACIFTEENMELTLHYLDMKSEFLGFVREMEYMKGEYKRAWRDKSKQELVENL